MSRNTATKLSAATLHSLQPEVRVPSYQRDQLQQHTVHIGVGSFHRAHQAVYLDDLLAVPSNERWGECGVGVLPGSAKHPKWLLPSIAELIARAGETKLLSLVVASWIFYLSHGKDEHGQPLDIIDARAGELTALAATSGLTPLGVLQVRSIFGEQLAVNKTFVQAIEQATNSLAAEGTWATMRHYLLDDQA